jgi:hypothetical protein
MSLSYDVASKIVVIESRLYALRAAATPRQTDAIDAQLARLATYTREADDVVMQHTDAEFAAAAKALKAQIKPINDAIAGIKQVSTAIATAAQIIDGILKVVSAVGVP